MIVADVWGREGFTVSVIGAQLKTPSFDTTNTLTDTTWQLALWMFFSDRKADSQVDGVICKYVSAMRGEL